MFLSLIHILYGIVLLIIDTTNQNKKNKKLKNSTSEYVDASYEEVTSENAK